jgi:predicted metalloprotease
MVVAGGGLGTLVIIIIALLLGADPRRLLQQMPAGPPGNAPGAGQPIDPAQEELAQFVRVVLADTEDVWNDQFRSEGRTYQEPKLVLFSGQVKSACGLASAAVGPFYCPRDGNAYLDLSFFEELDRRFGAPGDFAQAYVIAHEVGHHVQNLLGISDEVRSLQARASSESEVNDLSVRLELQADFLAGVWAHHAERMRNILEEGGIEEGLAAASAIGDDRLQRQSQGYVVPDSFTHGSSAQRVRWFRRGLQTGEMRAGDTFSADDL